MDLGGRKGVEGESQMAAQFQESDDQAAGVPLCQSHCWRGSCVWWKLFCVSTPSMQGHWLGVRVRSLALTHWWPLVPVLPAAGDLSAPCHVCWTHPIAASGGSGLGAPPTSSPAIDHNSLLSSYYVPGAVLGPGGAAVIPCFMEFIKSSDPQPAGNFVPRGH